MNSSRPAPLNLNKGGVLDLAKSAPSLKRAILGGGWDAAVAGPTADLDLAAFLLNSEGKITSGQDVIFFNHMADQGIALEGDNRTGAGDGDDERIDINLDEVNPNVQSIVFVITIYEAERKRQTFGMIKNAYVRLVDADDNEREICRYPLTSLYGSDTALIACALHRNRNGWEFEAIGDGAVGDLNVIAERYM